ncbi:MAG TPA: MBG domain-containing protein, partial [Candidatus Limnocylindrales bacterium]|nr:MBG domain-containing protein [Candidatus Limnocylindrales bacterium]
MSQSVTSVWSGRAPMARSLIVAIQVMLLILSAMGPAVMRAQEADESAQPPATEQPAEPTSEPTPEPDPEPTQEPADPDPTAAPAEPDPTDAPAQPDPTDEPTDAPSAPTSPSSPAYAPSGAPWIASDKDDYAPGETVTLTGGNWHAGESVQIYVNDDWSSSWYRSVYRTADDQGNITDQFNLPNWFVATYEVIATGEQSGVATWAFTDGNLRFLTTNSSTNFEASWTKHTSSSCPTGNVGGSTPTSGSGTVRHSSGNTLTAGANSGEWIRITAPGTIGSWTFSSWSGPSNFSSTNTTLCAPGFAGSGTNDYTANYVQAPAVTATSVGSITASTSTFGGTTNLSATVSPANVPGTVAFFVAGSTTAAAGTVSYDSSTGVATLSNYSHGLNFSTTAYSVRAVFTSSSSNYSNSEATNTSALTVNKKSVTVTPNSGQGKVYGDSDPTLTYSLSESVAVTGALARAAGSDVGSYAINLGTLTTTSTNHTLVLSGTPVNFGITPRPITITPNSGQSKVFGAADPTLTYTASEALIAGNSFTGALGRASGENVGNYAIGLGTLSAGTNYQLSLSTPVVNFAITAKPVTVTPN